MRQAEIKNGAALVEHLFRIEYGKIVSVITKFLGIDQLKKAEDIAQETFYKAVKDWQHNGIPPNPTAWLYVTAKNECLNAIKKKKHERKYKRITTAHSEHHIELSDLKFADHSISDGLLRMMFVCCHDAISKEAQLSLMLKVLCGFSISEIASAFFTSKETINKRLVRARKKLREHKVTIELPSIIEKEIPVVLQAIYMLFNEGYSPIIKDIVIRTDLCFEAIRLAELLVSNPKVENKDNCHALLSLMYLNVSRFEARQNERNEVVEMKYQDRSKWDKNLIDQGLLYLDKAIEYNAVSIYHVLAAISANHCVATNFDNTNWHEILNLYDSLITMEDSPFIRLNRSVALAKVKGNQAAISELNRLKSVSDIHEHHLFHSTIAEFLMEEENVPEAAKHLKMAIDIAKNIRDKDLYKKKLANVVPV